MKTRYEFSKKDLEILKGWAVAVIGEWDSLAGPEEDILLEQIELALREAS